MASNVLVSSSMAFRYVLQHKANRPNSTDEAPLRPPPAAFSDGDRINDFKHTYNKQSSNAFSSIPRISDPQPTTIRKHNFRTPPDMPAFWKSSETTRSRRTLAPSELVRNHSSMFCQWKYLHVEIDVLVQIVQSFLITNGGDLMC